MARSKGHDGLRQPLGETMATDLLHPQWSHMVPFATSSAQCWQETWWGQLPDKARLLLASLGVKNAREVISLEAGC